ncbi:3-oxoacyl-[acyl-carrier protein] reductase [Tissierella praeacuta DSM 18095]|uniref:3-oxoacyl-[acyl-carrier protein] reductase n=1 Tax=Tissierella praeacuta DSM 18095 TaxID=1123404 RepID=A0A1M4X2E3_9FIRM|nr:SDR family oxidoreductase [Tissierella praeacuta]SHE87688.1 3-oxoacyl-[acyl-carrier protein] reductase [Tissierella praeacuta DSM 18095]SUO99658.1 3-oxoacyl-[acyl-carrier-protein] reductase FabG [Tissierella praeacuta]
MKWIILTGDTGMLGSSIASRILEEKDYGVIGISRSENQITNDFKNRYDNRYFHIDYDLSNSREIKSLFKKEIQGVGKIYGLVNNSAYAYDDIITNAKIENVEKMLTINVTSPMVLTKYVIRNMLLNDTEGSIVHISSICAHTGYKGLSMYAATKGAIESFSRTIAREWGKRGIRSNCIAPGFMESSMSSSLSEEQKERIYKRNSLKKETDAISVASTVKFLLSKESRSITGQVIHVDNGTI